MGKNDIAEIRKERGGIKMKYRILPAFSVAVGLALIFALTSRAAGTGWYCVRAKDHARPRCDANMQYIENYGGYYISPRDEKVVYLTFDAGYENGNVEKILDTMKEKNVTGTFFVLGNLIERNGDLVKRMESEGHTVANHTYSHKDMTKCGSAEEFLAELSKLDTAYKTLTGKDMPKYYRPPEGKFDEKTLKYAYDAGYKTIFWSFAYADWDNDKQPDAASAKKKILDNVHNGAVILLHPTSATNAAVLGDVIDELRAEGYSFGSMEELTEGS